MMSLEDIGSIGEAVSAIAVLVTLIYLSYQVRMSNKFESANHLDTHMDRVRDFRMRIAESQDLSRIWRLGNTVQELSQEEQERFEHLAYTFLFIFRDAWMRAQIVKAVVADPEHHVRVLVHWFEQWPGLRDYWDNTLGKVPGPFPDAVRAHLAKGEK